MSLYRLEVSNLSRGKPKNANKQQATHGKESNACASVAYITGLHITCERTGKNYYYGRENRVAFKHTYLPKGASKEWEDPAVLWNEVENYEKGSRARLAKKFILALPNELTIKQCKKAVNEFAEYLTDMGYPVTAAVHTTVDKKGPKDPDNNHAHILSTDRRIGENGEWLPKQQKEYELDNDGNRVPLYYKGTKKQRVDSHGRKQWKRITIESNPIDDKGFVQNIRKVWEDICNQYLDEDHKISRLTNKARGLDRIANVHVGYGDGRAEENEILKEEIDKANKYIEDAKVQKVKKGIEFDDELASYGQQPSEEDIKDHKLRVIVCHHIPHVFDPSYDYENDPVAATHIVSDSPIINDLQHFYVKAAESNYDEITASSLQALAKTVLWLQKHDCLSTTAFAKEKAKITDEVNKEQDKLDDIKAELKDTNLQIKYMGKYLANKKSKNAEYWNAVSILRKAYPDKFPSMDALKEKRIALTKAKEAQQKVINEVDKNAYKLGIIEHNLNVALGRENIEKRYDKHIQREVKPQEPVPVRKVAEQEQPVNTTRTAPPVRKEPTVVEPTIVNPAPAQPEPIQAQEPVMPSYYDYGQYNNYAISQEPPRMQVPQSKQPPKPIHENVIHVLVAMDGYKPRELDIDNDLNSVFEQIGNNVDYDFHDDGTVVIWSKDQTDLCLVAKYTDTDDGGVDLGSLSPEQVQDYIYALRGDQDDLDYDNDELSYDNEQPHDRDGPEL